MFYTLKHYIAIFWFCATCNLLQAQDVSFRNLSVEDGLTQSAVFSIEQDVFGFLWFGTADGLNKYDGYQFSHLRSQPGDTNSLTDNFVLSLEASHREYLWVGTNGGGISKLDLRSGKSKNFRSDGSLKGLSHNDVYSLYEDDEGTLWAGTYNGLNRLDRDGKFSYYPYNDSVVYTVYDIVEAGTDGKLFLATDYGLLQYHARQDKVELAEGDLSSISQHYINTLMIDSRNQLWVGSENGVYVFNEDNGLLHHLTAEGESKLPFSMVTALFEDAAGRVWIGSNGNGVAVWTDEHEELQHYKHQDRNEFSLGQDVVTKIFEDRSGVLWIGTYGAGISKYDPYKNQFRLYRHIPGETQSIPEKRVFALESDQEENLWIGTDGGGLSRLRQQYNEEGELRHEHFAHFSAEGSDPLSLSSNKVWSLTLEDSLHIWVGTIGEGLNYLNLENGSNTVYRNDSNDTNSLSDNAIYSLYRDSSGIIWVGTDVGLNRLNPQTGAIERISINPREARVFSSNTVLAIAEDRFGDLWIGTFGGGLVQYRRGKGIIAHYKHDLSDPKSLSYDKVMSIFEDQKGRLWVGTFGGGFNLFDRESKSFEVYNENSGLPNDVVYGFLEDAEGRLWMSTNNGLSCFDPADESFHNYDVSSNLQSDEFNQGAFCKSKRGMFYFGGINGFNAFNPIQLKKNEFVPPIHITIKTSPDEPLIPGEFEEGYPSVELPYQSNSIFFNFVAFNYVNSERNSYRYRMRGLQDEWVPIGHRRTASFTNLDPGSYVFEVQAANNDGKWNTAGEKVFLKIDAPIYLEWWFLPFLFVLILLIVLSLTALIIYNVRAKAQLRVSQAEMNSYQYRLTSLRAQMDPHFIFNSLNSIQHFISGNDRKSARQYLSKFARLMRLILNNSKKETNSLEEELETLQHYLELERLRFEGQFDFEITVDDKLETADIRIPTMLLQPYVENAVIHGLKNLKDRKGKLDIVLKEENQRLLIAVEDNGVGREKARELKQRKMDRYESLGMKVTQDRLALYDKGGERPLVQVQDLLDPEGNPCGTRVEISLDLDLLLDI